MSYDVKAKYSEGMSYGIEGTFSDAMSYLVDSTAPEVLLEPLSYVTTVIEASSKSSKVKFIKKGTFTLTVWFVYLGLTNITLYSRRQLHWPSLKMQRHCPRIQPSQRSPPPPRRLL